MPPYNGPRGTGFTSLKQYLELNPESAQRMGDELVQGVNAKGTAAEQGINTYAGDFAQQVAAGTPKYKEVNSVSEAEALAKDATYKGPNEMDSKTVGALSGQATDAANRARALGNDAGRATLLGETYGKNGGYTPGAAGLDAFLAGRGAGGRAQEAGSRWGGLRATLGLAEKDGATKVGAARTAADGVAGQYRNRASTLAERAATAAQQRADELTAISTDRLNRMAPSIANQQQANNEWAGADNQVSPERKGPKMEDDLNKKVRRFPQW